MRHAHPSPQTRALAAACLALVATAAQAAPSQPDVKTAGDAATKPTTATAPAPDEKPKAAAKPKAATPAKAAAKRYTAYQASLVLKVADPVKARRDILAKVKSLTGRASLITDGRLSLRVPPPQLNRLLDDLATRGIVLDKRLTRRDITEQVARLRGRLRSKAEILGQLRGFLDDSGVSATLRIERTMTSLVTEIERLKGQLGVAVDRARYAQVDVRFQFRTPARLRYVRSPFAWIDTVDIGAFLGGF